MTEPLKIIIIEDEPLIAAGLAAIVQELGHETTAIFPSGIDALQQADSLDADLILVDINLPQMDGIAVMKEIHKRQPIPCIFITGYSELDLIQRAQSVFTFGYLIKPVDANDLRAAIGIAISRSHDFKNLYENMQKTQKALEDRKLIERAKGIIMDLLGMSEAQAMKYLQNKSRNTNKKLTAIAQEIINIERGTTS